MNGHSSFIGPAALNQVRLFNLHPSGKMHAAQRLEAVMGDGGVGDCGKAQNCVEVCPKENPAGRLDRVGFTAGHEAHALRLALK